MAEKIIIKHDYYEGGVDQTMLPPTTLGDNEVVWGLVTKPMVKERRKAKIGINQYLLKGEVISFRGREILYRINNRGYHDLSKKGYIYELKRLDGCSITSNDLDFPKVGDRVIFENRREYKQKIENELFNRKKQ